MPTQNIECQLAQGQIGRYLSGDRFSEEAVKQLEAHIAECEECSGVLAKRREAVIAMLAGSGLAVVQADQPSPAATAAVKLLSALSKKNPGPAPAKAVTPIAHGKAVVEMSVPGEKPLQGPAKPNIVAAIFPKPVLYCGGLALVLLGMSYFSRAGFGALGPNAGQSLPSSDAASEPVKPTALQPSSVKPSAPAALSSLHSPAALHLATSATPKPAPKPVAKQALAAKPGAKAFTEQAPAPRPAANVVAKQVPSPTRAAKAAEATAKAAILNIRHVHTAQPMAQPRPHHPRVRIKVRPAPPHFARHYRPRYAARPVHLRPRPSVHASGIRVYDPSGRILNP